MPRFSVIMAAKDAAGHLEASIGSIVRTWPEGGELVVVDDGSVDETGRIAERMGARVLRNEVNEGPAAARNRAVAASSGEVLVFLDADVEAHEGTIEALVRRVESGEVDAVMGSYDDEPTDRGLVSAFRNLLHHYTHQTGEREAVTFWTGCGAMRREAFERAGRFDASRRWLEDVDLGLRLSDAGGKIELAPEIQVKHRKRWTLRSMVVTDVWGRAIPWLELMRQRKGLRNDLNTRWRDRVCAALVLIGVALCWRAEGWALLSGATLLRGDWHWFLVRKRGVWFALRAAPLHWLYLGYSALTFVWVRVVDSRPST